MMNQEVPAEVLVKYLVRERDHYKGKMEQVAEYAKALEIRVQEMEKQIEQLKQQAEEVISEKRWTKFAKKYKKAVGQLNVVINQFNQITL